MVVYAHSTPGSDPKDWELLSTHLDVVAGTAARLASSFGCAGLAGLAGRLHDIGKCSAAFQAYIRQQRTSGGDHSSAGAREVLAAVPAPFGQALAAIIAGHHGGLADGVTLEERFEGPLSDYPNWQAQSGPLPEVASLVPTQPFQRSPDAGFWGAFLTRMLFSCLVDADSLETERFYHPTIERGHFRTLSVLRDRLDAHMKSIAAQAKATEVNALRAEILAHVRTRAALAPGLFTLTVPTGGGKTLASLSFALDHALLHKLHRVVYVIPYAGAWIETF